jgi:hypothetical protein
MEADADVSASFRHLSASPREIRAVKFVAERPLVDPDAAARKLVEIANATEAVQDGRLYIELINSAFVAAGGSPAGYPRRRAGGIDLASVPHDGGDECLCEQGGDVRAQCHGKLRARLPAPGAMRRYRARSSRGAPMPR